MSAISNFLVSVDQFTDHIPFVSTGTNLINIFQKCALMPCRNSEFVAKSPYYQYLEEKSFSKCIVLLIPVLGNISVAIQNENSNTKKDEHYLHEPVYDTHYTQPYSHEPYCHYARTEFNTLECNCNYKRWKM